MDVAAGDSDGAPAAVAHDVAFGGAVGAGGWRTRSAASGRRSPGVDASGGAAAFDDEADRGWGELAGRTVAGAGAPTRPWRSMGRNRAPSKCSSRIPRRWRSASRHRSTAWTGAQLGLGSEGDSDLAAGAFLVGLASADQDDQAAGSSRTSSSPGRRVRCGVGPRRSPVTAGHGRGSRAAHRARRLRRRRGSLPAVGPGRRSHNAVLALPRAGVLRRMPAQTSRTAGPRSGRVSLALVGQADDGAPPAEGGDGQSVGVHGQVGHDGVGLRGQWLSTGL